MNVNSVQLFDVERSTFTYLLVADDEKSAVNIDPVERHWERDVAHLKRLGLSLAYVWKPTRRPTMRLRPAGFAMSPALRLPYHAVVALLRHKCS